MNRSGNRRQTFGTGGGNFCRNCPNREQELAGFLREISGNAGRYPQLSQARCAPIAGFIAIVVTTAMLEAADWIPLVTR